MKKLKRKLIGWIDKIIIYHYMSAILIKLSEIETWVLSSLCQVIFTGGNADLQNDFNQRIETLPMGSKILYLKGEANDDLYTDESLGRIELAREHEEYENILKLLDEVKGMRNPFIHAKYFMGYANELDSRLSFQSTYIDRNGEVRNVDLTPSKIREKSKNLNDTYVGLRRIYTQLQIKLFRT